MIRVRFEPCCRVQLIQWHDSSVGNTTTALLEHVRHYSRQPSITSGWLLYLLLQWRNLLQPRNTSPVVIQLLRIFGPDQAVFRFFWRLWTRDGFIFEIKESMFGQSVEMQSRNPKKRFGNWNRHWNRMNIKPFERGRSTFLKVGNFFGGEFLN